MKALITPVALMALALSACNSTHVSREHYQGPDTPGSSDYATHAAQPETALMGDQPAYASPEDAVGALYKASSARDLNEVSRVLGLPREDMGTGDATRDAEQAAYFAQGHDEFINIVRQDDAHARVFVGKNNYPLATPLVRVGDKWRFDSAGGRQELQARVIGENELATIGVCRAYVQAQYEYYAEDRNGDDVLEYAQKLGSTTGSKDGLYWEPTGDDSQSPLGPLVARARASGFLRGEVSRLDEPKPYHGYLFRVLTSQGEHAAGGKYDYMVNGRMLAGFALVAYPAKYGRSGVMTFLVAANGKVYQKDLGAKTGEIAYAMETCDPDGSWMPVQD